MRLEMFDPAPIGVVFTRGPEHRLAYTNAVYRRIFGDRPLGRPLRRAFPDLAQSGDFDIFDRVLATGEAEVLTASTSRTRRRRRHATSRSASPGPR